MHGVTVPCTLASFLAMSAMQGNLFNLHWRMGRGGRNIAGGRTKRAGEAAGNLGGGNRPPGRPTPG